MIEFIALDARIGDVGDRADAGARADRDEIDRAGVDLADDGVLEPTFAPSARRYRRMKGEPWNHLIWTRPMKRRASHQRK